MLLQRVPLNDNIRGGPFTRHDTLRTDNMQYTGLVEPFMGRSCEFVNAPWFISSAVGGSGNPFSQIECKSDREEAGMGGVFGEEGFGQPGHT